MSVSVCVWPSVIICDTVARRPPSPDGLQLVSCLFQSVSNTVSSFVTQWQEDPLVLMAYKLYHVSFSLCLHCVIICDTVARRPPSPDGLQLVSCLFQSVSAPVSSFVTWWQEDPLALMAYKLCHVSFSVCLTQCHHLWHGGKKTP